MSFFWYDYETFGSNVAVDRPVQFAGVRTDERLQPIDEPVVLYCRPAPDYLPQPEACLVHGISPTKILESGLCEAEFAHRIHQELSAPDTCAVGYNAMRFDHEITRFLLYRNLRDPYAWHWRDGNSRWDVIDLLRAVHALCPDGIQWPARDDGAPSFRLEEVAEANGIRHENPHEAYADVKITLELARLIRTRHPDLFDYYFNLRRKREVARLIRRPFVWISGLIEAKRCCTTLMAPVADHPSNPNAVIAFDLRYDPSDYAAYSPDELRASIFDGEGDRAPLYTIKVNASPFVAPAGWLGDAVRARIGLEAEALKDHYRALQAADSFAECVRAAYCREFGKDGLDVDSALYVAFIPDGDREMLALMLDADPTLSGAPPITFEDDRIPELVFRYRARNYPESLTPEEERRWRGHCRTRHLEPNGNGLSALEAYEASIAALREQHAESSEVGALLEDLADHGRQVRRWLA